MMDLPLTIAEAAYLAGLHSGVYNGLNDITRAWQCARRYSPGMEPARREALYGGWKKAMACLIPE